MAHGLESRLPFLDHPLVELAATMPPGVKFEGGQLKRALRVAFAPILPTVINDRTDKMGFPTPLNIWAKGEAHGYVVDVLSSQAALSRPYIDNGLALEGLARTNAFGRGFWGLLSLELWQQAFHDRASEFRSLPATLKERGAA